MLQEIISLLPQDVGRFAVVVAIVGASIGAALWLTGSRMSRSLVTLSLVAIGAIVGLKLPTWCGWTIDGMGTCVGGAVALGVIGYTLHRYCVGVGLGLVLACWASLATWMLVPHGDGYDLPTTDPSMNLPQVVSEVWTSLPVKVQQVLPFACGAAMAAGIATAVFWPRVSVILFYSATGTTLLVGMGVAAMDFGRPQWLRMMPSQTWQQLATMMAMVSVGALVQWKLAPAIGAPSASEKAKKKK